MQGTESAIHATTVRFSYADIEGILLVDTFNSLNRKSALHSIRKLRSSIANVLINMYHDPAQLFVDGNILYSYEGTTQGDPLTVPFYALATLPLVHVR